MWQPSSRQDHTLSLLLHFSSVLGLEWPIYVFTPPSVIDMLQKSAVFNFSIEDCRVEISGLPMGVAVDYPFHNPLKRAKFLTRPRFWESLMPVEYMLLFSADRMICSKSELSIDDFLEIRFHQGANIWLEPRLGRRGYTRVSGKLFLRSRNATVNTAWKTG
jgi:hypothetical protein